MEDKVSSRGSQMALDEEELVSNVAVAGAASPRFTSQSPIDGERVQLRQDDVSAADSHSDGVAAVGTGRDGVNGVTNGAHFDPTHLPPPRRVALNETNLATFERSVQQGQLPLRTDLVDRGDAPPRAVPDVSTTHRHDVSTSVATNFPDTSRHTDASSLAPTAAVATTTTHTTSSVLLPATTAPERHPSPRVHETRAAPHGTGRSVPHTRHGSSRVSQRGSATGWLDSVSKADANDMSPGSSAVGDKMSMLSTESQLGRSGQHEADPLNEENLKQHLRELNSGAPLPLLSENIVPTAPHHPDTTHSDHLSRVPEPSETLPSITLAAGTAGASERASVQDVGSPLAEPTTQRMNEVVEDMWSTASTGEGDLTFLSNSNAGQSERVTGQSLNKENLSHLKHQLESGKNPLRPELLAGLSGFVRSMARSHCQSEVSSMLVEVPRDEPQLQRGPTAASPPTASRHHPTGRASAAVPRTGWARRESPPLTASTATAPVVAAAEPQGRYRAAPTAAGHGPRPIALPDAAAAAGRELEYNCATSFHSTVVEVPQTEAPEADAVEEENDDDVVGATADSAEACSSIHDEDVGTNPSLEADRKKSGTPCSGELPSEPTQRGDELTGCDMRLLKQQIAHVRKALVASETGMDAFQRSLEERLNKVVAAMEHQLRYTERLAQEMQQVRHMIVELSGGAGEDGATGTRRVAPVPCVMRCEGDTQREYVVPLRLSDTVGACKGEFLRRLRAQSDAVADALDVHNTVLCIGGRALFDEDVLQDSLGAAPVSGRPPYTFTLHPLKTSSS